MKGIILVKLQLHVTKNIAQHIEIGCSRKLQSSL